MFHDELPPLREPPSPQLALYVPQVMIGCCGLVRVRVWVVRRAVE